MVTEEQAENRLEELRTKRDEIAMALDDIDREIIEFETTYECSECRDTFREADFNEAHGVCDNCYIKYCEVVE